MRPHLMRDDLAGFESLFDGLLAWLPRLHDAQSGGFYYALSSRTQPQFAPDIESTCMALRIIKQYDLLESLPASVHAGLVRFLQARQDPDSGFFFDPHNEMRTIERMRGRALSSALDALENLGVRALHPLPGTGATEDTYLHHLQSVASFEAWLDERPWDNSWMAQDNIQAQSSLIKLLPEERQDELVDAALAHVLRRQDLKTGYAGGGAPYVRLSGAFKLALFCRAFDRPVPYAERIYESTLACLREETCEDACWLRNPLELIEVLQPQLGPLPQTELAEVVHISTRNARRFAQPDGGFSRSSDGASPSPNEVVLGLGLAEGDLNASVQLATIVRPTLYRFADVEVPRAGGPDAWAARFAQT
ncbi:hypothetical protein [Streptomyces sp. bgisy091]|uniref:hypothetical protein n=1 Tax=Streptomyces sp. bgisy091 TaxID=3413778 RepID=UPI003D719D3C